MNSRAFMTAWKCDNQQYVSRVGRRCFYTRWFETSHISNTRPANKKLCAISLNNSLWFRVEFAFLASMKTEDVDQPHINSTKRPFVQKEQRDCIHFKSYCRELSDETSTWTVAEMPLRVSSSTTRKGKSTRRVTPISPKVERCQTIR